MSFHGLTKLLHDMASPSSSLAFSVMLSLSFSYIGLLLVSQMGHHSFLHVLLQMFFPLLGETTWSAHSEINRYSQTMIRAMEEKYRVRKENLIRM